MKGLLPVIAGLLLVIMFFTIEYKLELISRFSNIVSVNVTSEELKSNFIKSKLNQFNSKIGEKIDKDDILELQSLERFILGEIDEISKDDKRKILTSLSDLSSRAYYYEGY
jgi:hypothetical protein